MTETDYERARATADRELSKLLEERDEIERRILALRQTLSGLAMLAGDETQTGPSRTGSVTGEIRTILRTATEPMTVRHVRNTLIALGYDIGDERSSMAKVQTMLSRMVVSSEAIEKETKDGKAYIWQRVAHPGAEQMARQLSGKRIAQSVAAKDSAYTSGMRGSEKPKK